MTTDQRSEQRSESEQVEFTFDELLMDDPIAEPLVANGVRCHGGFDADGRYLSPRTRFRAPAIRAWERQRATQFGTPTLAAPLDDWPDHFPNVEQSTYLIRQGVREPMITEITRVGTVEGFGALMRHQPLPDFGAIFDDITGTATEHIRKGLFEAHARDEAGWEAEAGHNVMWFAVRDIAFEAPVTDDQTELMLERMGIKVPGRNGPSFEEMIAKLEARRVLPSDIPFELEMMLTRMISLLFIEISAFHVFAWAEAVLADPDLVAGEGEAARLVSHIRQDETPHVGYLTVALSEMRDRSWKGATGTVYDGAEMISLLWDPLLQESRQTRRQDFLRNTVTEIQHAVADRTDRDDLMDEFWSLGSLRPLADGGFVETLSDGRQLEIPAPARA